MRLRMAFQAWTLGIGAIMIAAVGWTADAKPVNPPQHILSAETCQAAKAEFRAITAADVAKAKTVLVDALDRLDERLTQAGPGGDAWRTYLLWDALQKELRGSGQPDRTLLTRVHTRLNAGHEGLELVWFLDVQRALHNYIATSGVSDNQRLRAAYEKKIDLLAATLDRYLARPTTEDALTINESIRWLQDAHQAPKLVAAIQQKFNHPNLKAQLSDSLVGVGLAEPVDDTMEVRDFILGTQIFGTAHTVGKTRIALSPNAEMAVIDALFFGTTKSENVGYNGPVTIFSESTTRLAAAKRIWIDDTGLASHPAASNAETDITINDIQAKRGFIEKLAWRRAGKQQPKAEALASSHAEERLNERIDRQAEEAIERANREYREKFQRPFVERKLFPESLGLSTTERFLRVVALQAGGGKLAAPSEPPAVAAGAEMSLCVHESMINNLAFDALAGRTVYEEKMQAAVKDLLGRLPEKMKGEQDGKPWAITFASPRPVIVSFADGGFRITLCGAKYYKGGEGHPAMNVTAVYKIVKTADSFKAVRQGTIEVFPPDFVPGSGQTIDAKRQVIRKLLENRFSNVFEAEMLGKGLELPGKWKAAGRLVPIQVECRDGWLVVAWKRAGNP